MRNTRVAGHGLVSEGAPHDAEGTRIFQGYTLANSGSGRALCKCGEMSEELPSTGARQRWHAAHKQEVLDAQ